MSPVARFLDWLGRIAVKAERERREASLAGSANLSELEHRMRMFDRADTSTMRGL
jgi:hypothetical protein